MRYTWIFFNGIPPTIDPWLVLYSPRRLGGMWSAAEVPSRNSNFPSPLTLFDGVRSDEAHQAPSIHALFWSGTKKSHTRILRTYLGFGNMQTVGWTFRMSSLIAWWNTLEALIPRDLLPPNLWRSEFLGFTWGHLRWCALISIHVGCWSKTVDIRVKYLPLSTLFVQCDPFGGKGIHISHGKPRT